MTTEAASPPALGQTRVFAIIEAALFLNDTVALMLGPLLAEIAEEFDTSVAVAGQLAAATFASWAVLTPFVGPISDSLGRRPVGLTGLSLMGTRILVAAVFSSVVIAGFMRQPNTQE